MVFFFFLELIASVQRVQVRHVAEGVESRLGRESQLCAGVTTPRRRRRRRRAALQARLTPMLHPGALLGLHYKPCEDGDLREECIIILRLYRAEEHTGELQPRGGGRAGLVVGDPLFEFWAGVSFWGFFFAREGLCVGSIVQGGWFDS